MQKTIQEIDDFIQSPKSKIAACILGCGQVIENQIVEYKKHDCIITCCIKWNAKCKNCKRVLGPRGEILTGSDQIISTWNSHDKLISRIKAKYQTDQDDPEDFENEIDFEDK